MQQILNLNGNGPSRVIVKFAFTNDRHIPTGISRKERQADHVVDANHMVEAVKAGQSDKAQIGRHREGRVDSGEPLVKDLPMVQTAMIRTGLVNNGYRLTDAHYFTKPPAQRGHKPKHIVCLTFSRESATAAALPEPTTRALRELARTTWQFGHIWSNPDGTATINLVGRQWDDAAQTYRNPEHALVVRNHQLCAVPVTAHVGESDE